MKTPSQKLASLMAKYENGAIIQKRRQNDVDALWEDTTFPEWNIALFDYRLAPKGKTRKKNESYMGFIIKNSRNSRYDVTMDKQLRSRFKEDGAYSCVVTIKERKDLIEKDGNK